MKHIIKNHKRGLSVLMMLFLLFVISGAESKKQIWLSGIR